MEATSFGVPDYIALGVMLCISMAIGIYFAFTGNKQNTRAEYLLGNRTMRTIPVCLSMFATFQSAIALLGIPAEIYTYGTMMFYGGIGGGLGYVFSVFTIVPLIYPLGITSVNQYLKRRFQSRLIHMLGAFLGILTSLSYMTIALLSPALAVQTAVGIPLWISIIIVGVVGTVYTTLGGIKSVIWTDAFQTAVMFLGLFTVVFKVSADLGGFKEVWNLGEASGRIILNEISLDPRVRHTVWGLVFANSVYWFSVSWQQSSIQRIVATKSLEGAKRVMALNTPLALVYSSLLCFTGLVMVSYFYAQSCDPLGAGFVTNTNQLMPYFVMETFGFLPGLPGLYIATIFSGALSTLSSGINSLAANTVEDFLGRFLKGKPEQFVTTLTKIIVCFYGLATIGLAYLVRQFSGPVTQLTYTALSAVGGPLLGLFMLGATMPHANVQGSFTGCMIGLVASIWLTIGRVMYGQKAPRIPAMSTSSCRTRNVNVSSVVSSTAMPGEIYSTISYYEYYGTRTDLNTVTQSANDTIVPKSYSEGAFSLYDVSYIMSPLIGALICYICGIIISFVTNVLSGRSTKGEPQYILPWLRKYWYKHHELERIPTTDSALKMENLVQFES